MPATSPSTRPRAPRRSAASCTGCPRTTSRTCACGRTSRGWSRCAWDLAHQAAPARAAAAALGARARLPRALLHQEPALLDHVHAAAPGAARAPAAPRARRRATRSVGPADERRRVRRAAALDVHRHRLPHARRRVARRDAPARERASVAGSRGEELRGSPRSGVLPVRRSIQEVRREAGQRRSGSGTSRRGRSPSGSGCRRTRSCATTARAGSRAGGCRARSARCGSCGARWRRRGTAATSSS